MFQTHLFIGEHGCSPSQLQTLYPWGTWLLLKTIQDLFTLGDMVVPQGNLRFFSLGDMVVPQGNLGLFLLGGDVYDCKKIRNMIVPQGIQAFPQGKCIVLQGSCSSPQGSYRFPQETWALPWGKFIVPQGTFFSSFCKLVFKIFHLFLREFFYSMGNLHCFFKQLAWD